MSRISLWRIDGNPPRGQFRACSTVNCLPQMQWEGRCAGCQPYRSLRTAFFVVRSLAFLVLRTLYPPYLWYIVHTLYPPYLWYYALSTHRLFGSTHSLRTVFWYYALSTHRIYVVHTLYAPYLWYYALSTHRLFGSTYSLRTVFLVLRTLYAPFLCSRTLRTAFLIFLIFLFIVKNIFVTRNTIKTGEKEEIVIQKLFTEM